MIPTAPTLIDDYSDTEIRIYQFVLNYQHRWRKAPSVEEIRQELSLASSGTIMSLLGRMQQRGLLKTSYQFRIPDMTPAQSEVYWFIVEYKKANDGTSPTIREIMAGTDYNSTSAVRRTIMQLHDMGLIQVDYPNVRTIRVPGGSYQYNGLGAAA